MAAGFSAQWPVWERTESSSNFASEFASLPPISVPLMENLRDYEKQTDRRRHCLLFITHHRSDAMLMELPQGKHQNH
jgi:hypothetical protein